MITSVVDFVRTHTLAHPRPWLVVGKGPSADYIARVDTREYNVVTLNHACRVVRPALAHFIDLEALAECEPHLTGVPVALPWHPHRHFKPVAATLDDLAEQDGLIRRHYHTGIPSTLLYGYNSTTANKLARNIRLPVLRVRFFSATAAFAILCAAGVREIHSLGVDGGTGYADGFDPKTRLANGRKTFDDQTPEIERTVRMAKAGWTRLDPKTTFENPS